MAASLKCTAHPSIVETSHIVKGKLRPFSRIQCGLRNSWGCYCPKKRERYVFNKSCLR